MPSFNTFYSEEPQVNKRAQDTSNEAYATSTQDKERLPTVEILESSSQGDSAKLTDAKK